MIIRICLSFLLFYLMIAPRAICNEAPQPAKGQLGPGAIYAASDLRDPFELPIVVPEEETQEVKEEAAAEIKPKLSDSVSLTIQGMVWNSDNPLVIINNQILRKGEILTFPQGSAIDKAKIMDINKDGVTILYAGGAEKISPSAISQAAAIKGGRDDQTKSPFFNP
jgi:type II secretory pathway component PulC